jgi:hypothetical protein
LPFAWGVAVPTDTLYLDVALPPEIPTILDELGYKLFKGRRDGFADCWAEATVRTPDDQAPTPVALATIEQEYTVDGTAILKLDIYIYNIRDFLFYIIFLN